MRALCSGRGKSRTRAAKRRMGGKGIRDRLQQLFVREFWHVLRRDRLGVKRERVWWFEWLGIDFDMAREGASENRKTSTTGETRRGSSHTWTNKVAKVRTSKVAEGARYQRRRRMADRLRMRWCLWVTFWYQGWGIQASCRAM